MDFLRCWFGPKKEIHELQEAPIARPAERRDRRAGVLIARLLHLYARTLVDDPHSWIRRALEDLELFGVDVDPSWASPVVCQYDFEDLLSAPPAPREGRDPLSEKLWKEDLVRSPSRRRGPQPRAAPAAWRCAERKRAGTSEEGTTESQESPPEALSDPATTTAPSSSSDSESAPPLARRPAPPAEEEKEATATGEEEVEGGVGAAGEGATLSDLPEALLAHVFSFLDPARFPQRLFTAALVCRRWMEVALGPEFRLELVLDRLPLEGPASLEFETLLALCRRHAHQVRQLRFSVDRESWLRAGHVSGLLAALPRLERLELGLSKFVDPVLVVEHARLRVLKLQGDALYASLGDELPDWEVAFDLEMRCPSLRTFHSEASLNFFPLIPSLTNLEYLHVDKYGLVTDEPLMRRLAAQNRELKLLTLQRKSPQTRFVLDFFPRFERVSLNHVAPAAAAAILRALDEHEREWHSLHLHHEADEALVAAVVARPSLRRVADLRLSLRRMPPPAVAALAALRTVKSLWLYDSWQEGDKIAALLAALPSARTLCLNGPLAAATLAATAAARAGAAIAKLRVRKAGSAGLSGAALRAIRAAFPALTALEIDKAGGGPLEEEALGALAEGGGGALRELAVHEEQLDPARARALRAALPDCRLTITSRPALLPSPPPHHPAPAPHLAPEPPTP
eukprot:tig00000889_g5292.t2